MSGHTALILGAGFSKPADGPLLRDLLSRKFVERSAAESEVLSAIVSLHEERNREGQQSATMEDLFTEIWREARTAGTIAVSNSSWNAADLLYGLTVHLASTCGDIHLRRKSRLWHLYLGFLGAVWRESRTLTVVTFNYDLLLEQLLDDMDLRFDYGDPGAIDFDDDDRRRRIRRSGADLAILKLHGSSNWGICRGCRKAERYEDQVTAFEGAYVPLRRRSCPWCDERYLDSGIIPPILGKAGESRHMEPIWRLARKAVKRSREAIIIGYSLPQSDIEAISLFREIASPPSRPRITVVCGSRGAPPSYGKVLGKFTDAKQSFETFAESFAR